MNLLLREDAEQRPEIIKLYFSKTVFEKTLSLSENFMFGL